MFKHTIIGVAVACSTLWGSHPAWSFDDQGSESKEPTSQASQITDRFLDEIIVWLASNFDLAAIKDRPFIRFTSKMALARMHATDQEHWQGLTQPHLDESTQRQVVALYDTKSKTIFLPDDWLGTTPAEQSVLVHEMVHHIQNSAQLNFECPMAREKLAYLAQDKWLQQFGTSLEKEFDVDMFTVLISSACAY